MRRRAGLPPRRSEGAAPRPASAQVAVRHVDQLVVHALGLVPAGLDRRPRAALEVVAEQFLAHAAERLVHGRDLRQDVRAVALLLDHPLEAADLPLDAAQPLQVPLLDLRVHAHRPAGAVGVLQVPAAHPHWRVHRPILPRLRHHALLASVSAPPLSPPTAPADGVPAACTASSAGTGAADAAGRSAGNAAPDDVAPDPVAPPAGAPAPAARTDGSPAATARAPCLAPRRNARPVRPSRRLFPTTLTELNAMAALARIGLSSTPNAGYSAPAAIGIPALL